MKLGKLGFLSFLATTSLFAADPVRIQINSYSIRFHPAVEETFFGVEYVNQVSSLGRFAAPNGELEVAPEEIPTSHWGTFFFTDGIIFETFPMDFILDVPFTDVNDNGVPDLVEYAPGATATSFGQYEDPEGSVGNFRADWSKPENSTIGTCNITFDFFGQPFRHTIEIYDYLGTLGPISRTGTTGMANASLERQGAPDSKLSGPMSFSFATPGRLELTSSLLKTESGADFQWTNPEVLSRDRGDLYQFLDVVDGTPPDEPQDFHAWLLVITDPNDSDGDGTPDIIDTVAPPVEPRLEIIKTEGGVRLLIHGEIGRAYTLEQSATIPAVAWTNPTPVTPAADPHVIDLPTADAATYWRLRTP